MNTFSLELEFPHFLTSVYLFVKFFHNNPVNFCSADSLQRHSLLAESSVLIVLSPPKFLRPTFALFGIPQRVRFLLEIDSTAWLSCRQLVLPVLSYLTPGLKVFFNSWEMFSFPVAHFAVATTWNTRITRLIVRMYKPVKQKLFWDFL